MVNPHSADAQREFVLPLSTARVAYKGRVGEPDKEERHWDGYLMPGKIVRRAGFMPDSFRAVYWCCKLLLGASLPLLSYEAELHLPFVWCAAIGLVVSFAVDAWLWLRMKSRQLRIGYALSYFVDMITAFLRAGVNLDTAISRAIEYGLPVRNPLREELRVVRSEIRAGRPRDEAFHALWSRTGVRELQSLANAFRIGFDIGSPIIAVLERQAELLRERGRETRQKRIYVKAAQAMIPLVLLNFPLMAMIVFYPPLLELANIFLSF